MKKLQDLRKIKTHGRVTVREDMEAGLADRSVEQVGEAMFFCKAKA